MRKSPRRNLIVFLAHRQSKSGAYARRVLTLRGTPPRARRAPAPCAPTTRARGASTVTHLNMLTCPYPNAHCGNRSARSAGRSAAVPVLSSHQVPASPAGSYALLCTVLPATAST